MFYLCVYVSQACIKPTEDGRSGDAKAVLTPGRVQVSLTDCLACSGCVTSAETILIEQQSHTEVYNLLESNKLCGDESRRMIVVTLSHQAIVSISAKYELPPQIAAEKLVSFFKDFISAYKVYDLTLARHIALLEGQKEFVDHVTQESTRDTPLFSSLCPGWVCYAEKTHGDLMVPHLSRVKSPQQIAGTILKYAICEKEFSIIADKLYHITLMPCFDKKLEASRKEFIHGSVKDVDCVLTPVEMELMFEKENVSFSSLPCQKLDLIHELWPSQSLRSHLGSGSGGYTENIARSLMKIDDNGDKLSYKVERNKDFITISIPASGDRRPLTLAVVNGFRNIQTLVQRMKRKSLKLNYVEVMACPKGCLNGGAQLKHSHSSSSDSAVEYFDLLESTYKSIPICEVPFDSQTEPLKTIYSDWFATQETTVNRLYTQFHSVPKTSNLLTATW